MLVIDASCLDEVLVGTPRAEQIRALLASEKDQAAPHIVDAEVYGVIRREYVRGELDGTAASQAVDDLADWPAERYGHQPFLARARELRATVRGWDALFVALAEALDVPLLTTDRRLGSAPGPTCEIRVVGSSR